MGLTGGIRFPGEVDIFGEHWGDRRHFFFYLLRTDQLICHFVDDSRQNPNQIDVFVSKCFQFVSQRFNEPRPSVAFAPWVDA